MDYLQLWTTGLCIIRDLKSESGRLLNGRVAEVMSHDLQSARLCVRIYPNDPKHAWKKLKGENVSFLSTEKLRAVGHFSNPGPQRLCVPQLALALYDTSSLLDDIFKSICELLPMWQRQEEELWEGSDENGVSEGPTVKKMNAANLSEAMRKHFWEYERGYDLAADPKRYQLLGRAQYILQAMSNNALVLILHIQSPDTSLAALVMKSKALVKAFDKFKNLLVEEKKLGMCAITLDMGDEVPATSVAKVDDALELLCESLCTDFALKNVLRLGVPCAFSGKKDMVEQHIDSSIPGIKEYPDEIYEAAWPDPDPTLVEAISPEEEPAIISPAEASAIEESLWASQVEHFISTGRDAQVEGGVDKDSSRAVILTFSRNPQELEDAILNSPLGQQKHQEGVEIKPAWANGAKVLLEGVRPDRLDIETLRPWHVIVAEKDELSLVSSLQHLPYAIRKLRPSGRAMVPDDLSLLNISSGADSSNSSLSASETTAQDDKSHVIEYQVKGIFIHFHESLDNRTVRSV